MDVHPSIRPSIQGATEKMKSGAAEFKDAVVNQSSDMFSRCTDKTEGMIKNNPYTSVLIAFGVGAALAGLLFMRRK
jgi:ElaB/YqjD/DUF883 family membrane-anchored ribosome-binding protein